ncbi:binding-protein-dependent transport systems inner membrane component [Paenibacillus curdlanolyticus YK9]|uniref:Binding-protein-dependent transport systems inner membrane component n=1 Tax=Paenibacillus curdlanolyticus YK9 TaxID=717606 RepID=E0IBH9_9BACL|nr:sugar ABC transporter permease [Paenibacillus curdlanolyticus]EFM10059.1 binding-protein-dependent transport systems inner membrane component [Paenibacillus curdlanolyticus YK9]
MKQAAVARSATQTSKKKFNWQMWGLLFVLPEIVIFLLFLWIPIVKGIVYSFYDVDLANGNHFVGLQNYIDVIHSSEFLISIRNTLYFMFLCVVIGFWVPAVVAIAVSELRRFQGVARVAGYLPSVIPAIVLYGMWIWFYDPIGPINTFLQWLGLEPVDFLSKKMSMISIVIMETWQNFGGAVLIYIAAIVGIPRDLYEAAEIDGAGVWQRIRSITLPTMRPLLILMFLLQIINTSQSFQAQMAMTGGGPDNATLTYLLLMNREAFTYLHFGKATALGSMLFAVMVVLSFVYLKIQNRSDAA